MNKKLKICRTELPFNWRQQLSTSLKSSKINLTPGQISDILRGRNKNTDVTISVFKELKKLRRNTLKKRKQLVKLQKG